MKILVTNDDGVRAPGIRSLAEALRNIGDVVVVAPDRERSAVGHALTLHHPLRASEIRPAFFAVDGTPTDCVNLGIHTLLGSRPDIVVSGVNCGGNMGDDITYSGTVSAAMEATLMGIPALAVSLVTSGRGDNYAAASTFAARLVRIASERGLPPDTLLNVNVPDLPLEKLGGAVVTIQGKRDYEGKIVTKTDPRGRNYYWIGNGALQFRDLEGTDYYAVKRGLVSITPLHLDLTNYASLTMLKTWDFSEMTL
ncbi:5'/3'-nucleotidase SurE [Geobacter hydrogenophilus]|nr:5'/3'-nucleotidase SurE [Geobacter hydrogenophilus]MBT0895236.1 5'/3'-nucleotidase SurE [Geobacter hydrogenophilus]